MAEATLSDLIERARTDRDFRDRTVADLEGTLKAEGYELSEDELAAAREMHRQAQRMSDEELDAALTDEVVGHRGS